MTPANTIKGSENCAADVRRRKMRRTHKLWHLYPSWAWVPLDAGTAFIAMWLGFRCSPSAEIAARTWEHADVTTASLIFAIAACICSVSLGASHHPNATSRIRIATLVLTLTLVAEVIVTAVLALAFYKQIGRYIIAISGGAFLSLQLVMRLWWFTHITRSVHKVGVIGANSVVLQLEALVRNSALPIKIVQLGTLAGMYEAALREGCHEIVVASGAADRRQELLAALDSDIAVTMVDSFVERHFFKVPVDLIDLAWVYRLDLKQHHPLYGAVKRVVDVAAAVAIGFVSLPLLAVAVVLVRIESRGAVLYSQTRVGRSQRLFRIWKVRSMRVDAEEFGRPRWASANDARVTRVGRFLRKTRIDELPQLWNILVGDMSLVGPRPERPEFVEQLSLSIPFYRVRHAVKPGLTGWAQICYRYGASVEDAREKLSYDLYYIKNATISLDAQIIVQTISAVAKGAR